MKELRKSPDGKNFLSIMETISKFYSKYSETNLHEEFWNAELTHKATHRELALHDFLRIDIVRVSTQQTLDFFRTFEFFDFFMIACKP